MVGTATASQLTSSARADSSSGVRFELATLEHDAGLRRLLRENPMPGFISLSLEREPSFFSAATLEGPEHEAIVAMENDRVIACGTVSARQRFINGRAMRVGYLGALRLDRSCRGRSSILRRGYEAFGRLHAQGGPQIYLTSIVAENLPARRFLERGLSGMPSYRFLGEFVTIIIRRLHRTNLLQSASGRRFRMPELSLEPGSEERRSEILELLTREPQKYQFAPLWSANELDPETFQLAYTANGIMMACAAISDQRKMKQTVVRGYSGYLRWARPVINLGATILNRPRLPGIGTPIPQAFISHLVVPSDQPQVAGCLINRLRQFACAPDIDYLALGFDSRDLRLTHLRKLFRPREYVSRIYVAYWEDGAELAESLDDRLLAPEVATL